jgi:hypothetical protein
MPAPSSARRLAPLLLLTLAAGCGPREGHLSGQVLYKNKPVPGGFVTFRPADNRANTVSVPIDENGHYSATVPAGEAKVAVDNRNLEPQPRERPSTGLPPGIKLPPGFKAPTGPAAAPESAPEKASGRYVALPDKYYDADKSGLKVTVKGGAQDQNIELAP